MVHTRARGGVAHLLMACAAMIPGGAAMAQAGYEPPLRANDLGPEERYSAGVHSKENPTQVLGKDIGARRLGADNIWSGLKTANADKKILSNWVVYGKPFYAIASGTVVGCWRNAPENIPGSKHAEFTKGNMPFGGNHLWVLQDDGNHVLYAHAPAGGIEASLCPHNAALLTSTKRDGNSPSLLLETKVTNGARIVAGQKLGVIGNSGDSSGPHLHVHVVKNGVPQPMPFKRGMTNTLVNDAAEINGTWTPLAGKEMPLAPVLLWAPHRIGNYSFNGVASANYQRMVDHLADSGIMPDIVTCKANGATYDSKWVPAQGKWATFHGMSAAEAAARHADYTKQGYKRTSSYTCGSASVAVWRK
ncbi:M23 family metallopeptidase [Sphingomonas colocasiae]|uniref:M23 family metallopeptidase n=1 Tax=Sphingomonas colocasiae TaxID=1848973 RepID=A0ABS7PT29_9SPHN|nr:M23 family metallopeptidase [Sphingomonas colocasiae]MBY8823830.1 M23 family metallopeptidase [Sphingomonas colocasiae]